MNWQVDTKARECADGAIKIFVGHMEYGEAGRMDRVRELIATAIAALVRRAVEEARAEEREACAKMCDAAERLALRDRSSEGARTALDCAAAIRARAAKEGK